MQWFTLPFSKQIWMDLEIYLPHINISSIILLTAFILIHLFCMIGSNNHNNFLFIAKRGLKWFIYLTVCGPCHRTTPKQTIYSDCSCLIHDTHNNPCPYLSLYKLILDKYTRRHPTDLHKEVIMQVTNCRSYSCSAWTWFAPGNEWYVMGSAWIRYSMIHIFK